MKSGNEAYVSKLLIPVQVALRCYRGFLPREFFNLLRSLIGKKLESLIEITIIPIKRYKFIKLEITSSLGISN